MILSFSLFITAPLHAACNTGAIVYKKQTTYGISIGGGGAKSEWGDSSSINVPLTINGQQACFRKKTKFTLKAENSQNVDEGKITISPMKTEYENIPEPSTRQYLFVEKNAEKISTKFHIMSFICSGEIPLSIEATSDSYAKVLQNSSQVNVSVTTVFATGQAAENLNKAKIKYAASETFSFFSKLYKEKTLKELDAIPCCGQKIPSIISDTSITALSGIERTIASSFTTMGSEVPNGCSKDFMSSMESYLLENFENNDSLKDYKVKKKFFSDDLSFEWK